MSYRHMLVNVWTAAADFVSRFHRPKAKGWAFTFGSVSLDLSVHHVLTWLSALGVAVGIVCHIVGAVQTSLTNAQTRRLERESAAREAERHRAEMTAFVPALPGSKTRGFENLN